jgi:SAM-dependent methyltransferase
MTDTALKHVTPDDAEYLRLAAAEAAFWQRADGGFLEDMEVHGVNTPVERYTNRRFTGDERTYWFESIAATGPYRRGLILGASAMGQDARILDMNPGLHLTVCDISAGALGRWQQELGARFPGRIDTTTVDLNFADLPEAEYDLVVSSSTLHHVINLEHLAAQINRTLTPTGRFFLQDYVGESFYRFEPQKKRVMEFLHNRDIARQKGRKPGLIWLNEDRDRFSPFCAIRSGDILDVMGDALRQEKLRTAGAITGLLLYTAPADGARVGGVHLLRERIARRARKALPLLRGRAKSSILGETYMQELLLVDGVVSEVGLLKPFNAFAVYTKR